MNSKIFIILFCLAILLSCGVKAPPLAPPEKAIKSYIQSYTGQTEQIESDKKVNQLISPEKKK